MWKERPREFPEVFNQCEEQPRWNTVRDAEMKCSLTPVEEMKRKSGVPHGKIRRIDYEIKDWTVLHLKCPRKPNRTCKTMQRPGWIVEQVSFIADVWSLNETELKKNLEFFKVPKIKDGAHQV